jgi:long-chain acyl-CoA synthetase
VVTVNTLEANIPESVGIPLPGTEVRCGDNDELLTRGPCVMLGYWNNPDASAGCIDADGWFHTGDQARIDGKHVFITGRLKEIIVLSNGEKVPPADMELAITMDGLFSQVMVVGEGKPFLAALVVLDPAQYQRLVAEQGLNQAPGAAGEALEKILVQRIADRLKEFPGYAKIRRVAVVDQPWTAEDGLMTPTLKLKRPKVLARHSDQVEQLYAGH